MLKENLIKYFRSGEKEKEQFTIGVDFGHVIVNKKDLKAVAFSGPEGMESLLGALSQKGWQNIREGESLVGVEKNGTKVTLGPGCQFTLGVKGSESIKDIDGEYLNFLKDIFPLLEERKQIMLTVGYQPASKIAEIEFCPQNEGKFSAQYLKDQGQYIDNLIKGTVNTKITINYAHQDDFRKKLQVAYALTPVMNALFDNSPIFEGEIYEDHCLRSLMGENYHNSYVRGNLMKSEFGYGDYADFLINLLPQELSEKGEIDIAQTLDTLNLAFPNISLKNSFSITIDALPYPLNIAAIMLCKASLYNQDNLNSLYEYTRTITAQDVAKANHDSIKEGLNARLGQGTLLDLAKDLFFMAGTNSLSTEVHYLQPLEVVLFKGIIPREVTLKHLQEIKI